MKKLTLRYSLTQFTFWAAATGASSFATTYLLSCGLTAGRVGTLLAAAGLLSCITQPILADLIDRCKRFLLPQMLIGISILCAGCFCVQLIPNIPVTLIGLCYMAGIWLSDAMVPLMNALCVSYNETGYPINYGSARGIGSAASAIIALVLGYVVAFLGNTWMLLALIAFRFLCVLILLGYPAIQKQETVHKAAAQSSSMLAFLSKYRWYCAALVGILFLGMYHAMTENYLIAILGRMGGNSSHVGTALFISAMAGAPVIFCFQRIGRRLTDSRLLKIAACSFLLKALLIFFAQSITQIYLIQLLQITSYAFLAPTQVRFGQTRVQTADMVKGQAFSTAAYALGCSAGNFIGGELLMFGVDVMLIAGIGFTLIGTLILFATVNRKDSAVAAEKKSCI